MVRLLVEQTPPRLIIETLEKSGMGLALKVLVGVLGIPPSLTSLVALFKLNSWKVVDGLCEDLFGSKNVYFGISLALN